MAVTCGGDESSGDSEKVSRLIPISLKDSCHLKIKATVRIQ